MTKNIFQIRSNNVEYMRKRQFDPAYRFTQNQISARRRAINKFEVLNHYTDGRLTCECCGESYYFLTLDHIDGFGEQHRRETGELGSNGMYIYLRRGHFPPGFQILCYNCNSARKNFGGVCPHEFWDKMKKITAPREGKLLFKI